MKIVYVGHKEQKGDNVAATGLVWRRGEIHEVEDSAKAAKLLEHGLIWRDATGKSDAEIGAMLLPVLAPVKETPVVKILPTDSGVDSFIVKAPSDVLLRLHAKELTVVFMSEADADAFADWKLNHDTSPQNTGPTPEKVDKRTREYKQGLQRTA